MLQPREASGCRRLELSKIDCCNQVIILQMLRPREASGYRRLEHIMFLGSNIREVLKKSTILQFNFEDSGSRCIADMDDMQFQCAVPTIKYAMRVVFNILQAVSYNQLASSVT